MNNNEKGTSPHSKKRTKNSVEEKSIKSGSINLEFNNNNISNNSKLFGAESGSVFRRDSSTQPFKIKKNNVIFKKNFLELINVECWKKYNSDISETPSSKSKEQTKCTCIIF